MTTLAANPRRLGAQIGGVAVLHTWGQTLTHHPHVHCVVPGGGLSPDGTRWVAGRPNFFLAIKPFARLFRRVFLERLQKAFDAGTLSLFGDLVHLADPASVRSLAAHMRRAAWVVYAKKPFGGAAQVLEVFPPGRQFICQCDFRQNKLPAGQYCGSVNDCDNRL
jgi:Putative transposase